MPIPPDSNVLVFIADAREDRHGPRGRPAEGHVADKKGFAAAFRDVAGVEEGARESVFRDMGDAVSDKVKASLQGLPIVRSVDFKYWVPLLYSIKSAPFSNTLSSYGFFPVKSRPCVQ